MMTEWSWLGLQTRDLQMGQKTQPAKGVDSLEGNGLWGSAGTHRVWPTALASIAGVGLAGWLILMVVDSHPSSRPQLPPTTTVAVATARVGTAVSQFQVTGLIQAQSAIGLAFGEAGTVSMVNVTPGQTVQSGQVLATLDQRLFNAQLAQAKAQVAVAAAKFEAAQSGPAPDVLAADEATVQKDQALLQAAEQEEAQANLAARTGGNDPLTAAQNQVDKTRAALKQAQAIVAGSQIKYAQVQAQMSVSTPGTLDATVQTDAAILGADRQQLAIDQANVTTSGQRLSQDQKTLTQDQSLYGTLAAQYVDDEQAYQTALDNFNAWRGYGKNPYTDLVAKTGEVAQQAQSAYNTLKNAQIAVQSAQSNLAQAQQTVSDDEAATAKAAMQWQNAQNALANVSTTSQLSLAAAQNGVTQAEAAESAAQVAYHDALLSQKAVQAQQAATVQNARSAVTEAQANLNGAQAILSAARAPRSAASMAPYQQEVNAAQAAMNVLMAQHQHAILPAPFSGVVTAVPVVAGQSVTSATSVVELDSSQEVFQAPIPETMVAAIAVGDPARVVVKGSDQPIDARVASIGPAASPQSLTFTATLAFSGPLPTWVRANDWATATIVVHTTPSAVLIPASAIVTINGYPQVFVMDKKRQSVRLQTVQPAVTDGSLTAVSGLAPGSRVIVAGQTYLASGDRVRVTQTVPVGDLLQSTSIQGFLAAPAAPSRKATP